MGIFQFLSTLIEKNKISRRNKLNKLNKLNNQGMGTIEVILIIVVLVGLVVIFKSQITGLVELLFAKILGQVNKI